MIGWGEKVGRETHDQGVYLQGLGSGGECRGEKVNRPGCACAVTPVVQVELE